MGAKTSAGDVSNEITALERRKTALENHDDTWELLVRRDFLDSKRKDCERLKASLTHYGFSQWELHAVLIGAFMAQCGVSVIQGNGLAITTSLVTSLLLLQLRIYRDKYTLYTCTGSCGLYVALFSVSHLNYVAGKDGGGRHLDCLVLLGLLILALIHLVVFIVASKYSNGNFEGFYDTNVQVSLPDARQLHGLVLGLVVGIATVFAVARIYSLAYCGFVIVISSSFARLKFSGAIEASVNSLPPQRCFPVVRNLLSIIFTAAAIAASITSLFDGNIVTLKNQQTFVKWLQGVANVAVVVERMTALVAVFVLVLMLVFLVDLLFLISMLCKSSLETLQSLLHCRLVILGRLCYARHLEDVYYTYKLYTLDHAGRLKGVHTLRRHRRPVPVQLNICDVYYRLLNLVVGRGNGGGGCNPGCVSGGVLMSTSRFTLRTGARGSAAADYSRESGGAFDGVRVQGVTLDSSKGDLESDSNLPAAPKTSPPRSRSGHCQWRPLYCRLEAQNPTLRNSLEHNPLVRFNTLLRQWIVDVDLRVANEAKARESRLRQQRLEWLRQQQEKVWRPSFVSKSLPLNFYAGSGAPGPVGLNGLDATNDLSGANGLGGSGAVPLRTAKTFQGFKSSSDLGSSTNGTAAQSAYRRSMSIPTNPRESLTKVLEFPKVLEVSQRLYNKRCKTANVSDSFMNQRAGIIDRVRGSWLTRGDIDWNTWPSFGVDPNSGHFGKGFDASKCDFNFETIDRTLQGIFSNLEIWQKDHTSGVSGGILGGRSRGHVAIDLSGLESFRDPHGATNSLGESGGPRELLGGSGAEPLKTFRESELAFAFSQPLGYTQGANYTPNKTGHDLNWLDDTLESLLLTHMSSNRKASDLYNSQSLCSSPLQSSPLPQPTTILLPPDINTSENSPTSASVSVADSVPRVQKLESRRFHGVATVENLTRYYEHYKAASAAASAASTPIYKPLDRRNSSGADLEGTKVGEVELPSLPSMPQSQGTRKPLVPIYDFDEDARRSFNQVGVNKQRLLQCMKQLPLALQNSRDSSVCGVGKSSFGQFEHLPDWEHQKGVQRFQENQQEFEMHLERRPSGAKVVACAGEMSDEPMASSGGFASGNTTKAGNSPSSSSSATATGAGKVSATADWPEYDQEDDGEVEETFRESDGTYKGRRGSGAEPLKKSKDSYLHNVSKMPAANASTPVASGDASIRAMVTQMLDDTPSATESIMRELVEHLDIPDTASEDSFEYIYESKQQRGGVRDANL